MNIAKTLRGALNDITAAIVMISNGHRSAPAGSHDCDRCRRAPGSIL